MRRLILLLAFAGALPAWPASTLDKTPSIDAPTVADPGTIDFFFSHTFAVAGSKVINSPTFNFEGGVFPRVALQVQYATSSDIHGNVNEAFPALKVQALSQQRQEPLDLTVLAGYDTAASSADGEVVVSRAFWRVRPYLAARGFSDGYGLGGATFAGSVGLELQVLPMFSLVGDVGKVLAAENLDAIKAQSTKLAWSGGVAFKIPYTPHSISLFATNVNTHTPEGASRGGFEAWRFGFEFDVPIRNLARWAAIFSPSAPEAGGSPAQAAAATSSAQETAPGGPVQRVNLANLKFNPAELTVKRGTTVEWVNGDDVPHTVTAQDRSFRSGTMEKGKSYRHTFDRPGRYPYFCEFHPFMKGTVVVQ